MPNATGRSLTGRRGRRKKATEVAETPETEYSSDESTEDTTTDSTDKDDTKMSDWDEWSDNTSDEGDGGNVATLEAEPEPEHDADIPDFASMVEDAPADYTPQRASAGRKREPSPFDAIVLAAKDQGWKRVPHQGSEETIKVIKRQLQKAQHYHDLGMDLNVTDSHVEFNVRDKQARTRKTESGGENGQVVLDDAQVDSEGYDPNDRDE